MIIIVTSKLLLADFVYSLTAGTLLIEGMKDTAWVPLLVSAFACLLYLHCVPDGQAQAADDEQDGSTHMVVPICSS